MMRLSLQEIARACDGELFGPAEKEVSGVCTDSRNYRAGELFVALRGERFDAHDFIPEMDPAPDAVISEKRFEGIPTVLVPDTLKAFGKLASYWRSKVAPSVCVGVTGSVGKTTTKELIADVLKEKYRTHYTSGNFNNHIGLPITLFGMEEGTEALVCEMGMSARGEIEYLSGIAKPSLAVITNIGTSHMEILGSREAICEAKLEILSGMEKGSTIVLDGDEPLFRTERAKALLEGYRPVFVGFDPKCDIYPMDIYKGPASISFDVVSRDNEFRVTVPAIGDHFIKNALFAAAVGMLCGVENQKIRDGILAYAPTGLRQKIYEKNGICVIADCYNASPESMTAALKVLKSVDCKGRKIAVLGDMLELGDLLEKAHREVGLFCAKSGVDRLYTYGKAAYHILLGALEGGMGKDTATNSIDRDQVSAQLQEVLQPGDTVLFKASRRMKLEEIIALCGLSE